MSLFRHWKIALCLLAIVVVSGFAGGLIGHRTARQQLEQRNDPRSWNEHVAQVFDRTVKPTPEQGGKIQAHLDKAVRELQAIRLETIARSTNVIGRLIADVDRELTPEQRKAFETMKPKPGELTLDILKVKPPRDEKP
jgi:capsid protein